MGTSRQAVAWDPSPSTWIVWTGLWLLAVSMYSLWSKTPTVSQMIVGLAGGALGLAFFGPVRYELTGSQLIRRTAWSCRSFDLRDVIQLSVSDDRGALPPTLYCNFTGRRGVAVRVDSERNRRWAVNLCQSLGAAGRSRVLGDISYLEI